MVRATGDPGSPDDPSGTAAASARLRAALVDQLVRAGGVRSARVADALRAVPRHAFLPDVPLQRAYADDAVVTKRAADGTATSSASQPTVVAAMLEQLEVRPGQRVLEIGSGTGYNAALLSHLVGPRGAVTTVDVDADVVDEARRHLQAAGCGDVRVVCSDGEFGYAADAPYDRLVVTVGAWDLPPAWREQLGPHGRMVVPLRVRGMSRSLAFVRAGRLWRCVSAVPCAFVSMQGVGAVSVPTVVLSDEPAVTLVLDDERGQHLLAPESLPSALDHPGRTSGTGVPLGGQETLAPLEEWLAATAPGLCRVVADEEAVANDLVGRALPWGRAVLDGDTFAYLVALPAGDAAARDYEVGVRGHGRRAAEVVDAVATRVRAWDAAGRPGDALLVAAHSVDTPDDELTGGVVVDKRHTRMVLALRPRPI